MRESARKLWLQLVSIKGPPRSIALGFALGLYVGMSPTMGIQTGIAVFLAFILRLNLVSTSLGVWITNPLTAPFIYGITYMYGKRVLGLFSSSIQFMPTEKSYTLWTMIQKTPNVLIAMTVGGAILGIPIALLGYYFSYEAIIQYRKRLQDRVSHAVEKVIHHRGKDKREHAEPRHEDSTEKIDKDK